MDLEAALALAERIRAGAPPNQQSFGPLQPAASMAKNGSLEPIAVLYEPTTAPFLKWQRPRPLPHRGKLGWVTTQNSSGPAHAILDVSAVSVHTLASSRQLRPS